MMTWASMLMLMPPVLAETPTPIPLPSSVVMGVALLLGVTAFARFPSSRGRRRYRR